MGGLIKLKFSSYKMYFSPRGGTVSQNGILVTGIRYQNCLNVLLGLNLDDFLDACLLTNGNWVLDYVTFCLLYSGDHVGLIFDGHESEIRKLDH